ncbi:class II fructose-bisphosphate aldolase family protein [Alicyclobacillus sp.]|uniref:class II fructose-bisphosphate aldolase n=1 Tax=Alicyclobacillus sp. TaxID=61169 RepID=UPI0025BB0233|nr:class II fructose-bisphosphate aldolase family protein [Alicyclobacillus sp.]MCL6516660.1 class II fructose-bisphosphate aldolase family protein [Alicyclobacillus sp.]
MPLVRMMDVYARAQRQSWAVVGFAAYNLETVQALVQTADRLGAPVLVQTTPSNIDNAGIHLLAALVRAAADRVSVPVGLHLDHGDSIDRVRQCLEYGYTSVMIDGSHLPYAENVALTREAVRLAHARGVPVEAELGHVGGVEDDMAEAEAAYTDPDLAADFVEKTGVDALAVAIGTAHGLYRGEPKLDFDRLRAIRKRVSVPLVLHGASGVPDAAIRRAIAEGIVKINIATELKIPFAAALRTYLVENPEDSDPRRYFKPAQSAYAAVVAKKIRLAGAEGQYAGA